ncbi:MAG: hypothetical protein AAF215_25980 [Cyanobacteria bacterium P01_A01_bin.123]
MGDINGAWLGTYWQSELPTRFDASFVQGGNALSGSILDDSDLGEAQVSGEVIGRSIRFTKRYLMGGHAAIDYTGTLSEDGNHMQGQWRIKRYGTGSWEAHRNDNDLMQALARRQAQSQPVEALTGSKSR